MKLHISLITLSLASLSSLASAGSLDLLSSAHAGTYDNNGIITSQDFKSASASFSGTGSFGTISANAHVTDPSNSAATIDAFHSVSANIADELNGSFHIVQGWDARNVFLGYADVYSPGGYSTQTYTFNTAGDANLHVAFNSSLTASGDPTGFGIWNSFITVDGVNYFATDQNLGWVPPVTSGSWDVALSGAGTHVLQVNSFSNITGGLGTRLGSLDETLTFSAGTVPEPASLLAIGTGAAFLLRRRRR